MAAVVTVAPNSGLNAQKADIDPSRALSLTTSVNRDSPSSVSSPASAASPSTVSTPISALSTGPPIAIRPSTSNKPPPIKPSAAVSRRAGSTLMSSASTPQHMTLSMTSKEWVIPPRPKPGRKPATDTPPTKRKAQNRAAQRAFRERRAARVGELEEQLEEEKATHERTVSGLQERITHLEVETENLRSRCQWLESLLEKERQNRSNMTGKRDDSQQQIISSNSNPVSPHTQGQPGQVDRSHAMLSLQPAPPPNISSRSIHIAEPRPLAQPFSISQIVSPLEGATPVNLGCGNCQANSSCACADEVLRTADMAVGCGKCSLGTRCECLEETLGMPIAVADLKRPLPPSSSPSPSPDEKRQRSDAGIIMETDFTAIYSTQSHKEAAQPHLQPLTSIEPRDSCGFCKDGTYCVCADSMLTSASMLPPPSQQMAGHTQEHTPPPSEDDVVVPLAMEVTATGAIKLPRLRTLQQRETAKPATKFGGCGPNGPGTCAQCLADPKSGLFCRSLAANFQKNNSGSGGGCCGNSGPGGCCKAGQSQQDADPPLAAAPAAARPTNTMTSTGGPSIGFGLSLSCADAYKTLSSHRHFEEAADDIGSWLPKLKALPVPRPGPVGGRGRHGRAPIEVEAASIMSVLKDFDVRFGRGE
ncbi:hypothetical protein N657DRAFT_646847 [Parathielavia appendiculata]|uniref:BZIP domain-containing protein n=1 Tax=Parathielavia appendiculata TaxID=2587402 RepID=A0AAN6TWQ3_9PEZI|nr:hypothetical protein N657DRAFT_646847 [Parathielavia appendiculata]